MKPTDNYRRKDLTIELWEEINKLKKRNIKLQEREKILSFIDKLLEECRENNPLSDYWCGKEVGLTQLEGWIEEEK